jgi:rhodanese-related sulfurtransferase
MNSIEHSVFLLLIVAFFSGIIVLIVHVYTMKKKKKQEELGVVTVKDILGDDIFKDEDVIFLDVRTKREFQGGFIPNAQNVDFYGEGFLDDIKKLDKKKKYILYCRSGGRSLQAKHLMETMNFSHLYNLQGGVLEWEASGGPLVEPSLA